MITAITKGNVTTFNANAYPFDGATVCVIDLKHRGYRTLFLHGPHTAETRFPTRKAAMTYVMALLFGSHAKI